MTSFHLLQKHCLMEETSKEMAIAQCEESYKQGLLRMQKAWTASSESRGEESREGFLEQVTLKQAEELG